MVVDRRVGRDLDARRGLAAIDAPAPGGEDADVAAAADQAGHAHGIVAGRVHEAEAGRVDLLGIGVNRGERRLPALGHRAEALLVNGREPAFLVAVAGIVVDRAAVGAGVALPPVDEVHDLLTDLRRHRTPCEQVLRSVNLRGLREHTGAAVAHQLVGGNAQRGIGGDATVAVGTTAVFGQHELGNRLGRAPHRVGSGQQLRHGGGGGFDGFAHAAGVLNREEGRRLLARQWLRELVRLRHQMHLIHLAAQTDHHVARDVRMPCDAGGDALEELQRLARLDAAADLVGEGHHAINAREVPLKVRSAEPVRHVARDTGRAVHAGNHRDVIAGAGLATRAGVTLKLPHLRGGMISHRAHIRAEGVVAAERAQLHVVRVDVLAGGDALRGKANGLAVFDHPFAGRNLRHRQLVSGRDALGAREAERARLQLHPRFERAFYHDDVVGGMEPQRQVFKFQHARERNSGTPRIKCYARRIGVNAVLLD